jgi:hypothetical protein
MPGPREYELATAAERNKRSPAASCAREAYRAVRDGKLIKEPYVCETAENIQAHYKDYA